MPRRTQVVVATSLVWRTWAGVFHSRVLRGLVLSRQGDVVALGLGQGAQVGALGPVLAQQSVGVLIGAPLPRRLGVAEVDRQVGLSLELGVLGHLVAAVPGDRPAQRERQRGNHLGQAHPGQLSGVPARQRSQQDEPAGAFDQGDHRALARAAQQQVALPVARHRPVLGLGRPRRDPDVLGDPQSHPFRPAGLGLSLGALCAQVRGQLGLEGAFGLHEQRLVDRLVAHAHHRIIRELDRQRLRDLLRRPVRPQPLPHLLTQRPMVEPEVLGPTCLVLGKALRPRGVIDPQIPLPTSTSRGRLRRPRPRCREAPRQLPAHRRLVHPDDQGDLPLREPDPIRPLNRLPLLHRQPCTWL